MIYTQDLHSSKILKELFFDVTADCAPPALICTSIKDPVMMHSSGENGRKRKNDSDKRGAYRKFDEASSRMRDREQGDLDALTYLPWLGIPF